MRSSSVANSDRFCFLRGFPVSKSKLWFLRPPAVTKHPSRKPRGGMYVPLPIPTKCRIGCLCIPVLAVKTWSGWLPYGSFPTQRSRSVFYRVTLAENKRFRDYVKYPQCAPGPSCRLTTNMRFPNSLNNLDVNLRPRQPQDFFPRLVKHLPLGPLPSRHVHGRLTCVSFRGSEVKIRGAPGGGIGHRRNVGLELDVVPPPPGDYPSRLHITPSRLY